MGLLHTVDVVVIRRLSKWDVPVHFRAPYGAPHAAGRGAL